MLREKPDVLLTTDIKNCPRFLETMPPGLQLTPVFALDWFEDGRSAGGVDGMHLMVGAARDGFGGGVPASPVRGAPAGPEGGRMHRRLFQGRTARKAIAACWALPSTDRRENDFLRHKSVFQVSRTPQETVLAL